MVEKPFTYDQLYETSAEKEKIVMRQAMRCRICEHPSCTKGDTTDIRGIMRRVSVGNFTGAKKRWKETYTNLHTLEHYEACCIYTLEKVEAVKIRDVVAFIEGVKS